MTRVIVDIEADDLLEKVSVIHSLVLRDADTGELISSHADQRGYPSIAEGIEVLKQADLVYAHNGIRYDRPALLKVRGYEIPFEKLRDTQVIAGMRWTNLKETDARLVASGQLPGELRGKHKLEAWGYRLGVLKGNYGKTDGFAVWTPEMQKYCEQDTLVTWHLLQHIRKAGVSPLAVETELELAEYLRWQEDLGWPFNMESAVDLLGKLAGRREQLADELRGIFGTWTKPGKTFTPKRDNKRLGYKAGVPVTKTITVVFNPGSRDHIADRLKTLYGWQPTEFTDGGKPKVDEDTLKSLPESYPGVKHLMEYLLVSKRLGQLAEGKNAWLKLARKNTETGMYHIHHACLQSGTITHRAAHIQPNIAQVPKVGKPYGEECRGLFGVPKGWLQVGVDLSGIELRELAHFMARWDDGAYVKTVTEGKNEDGTDVHSVNRDALGLSGKSGRDHAKTFIYAYLYGSGDLNLGWLIPPSPEETREYKQGKAWNHAKGNLLKRGLPSDDYNVGCMVKGGLLRKSFQRNTPALKSLIEAVSAKAKECGYLILHDGRRVPVRHAHAALNSLLQGCGAVVAKRWIVLVARKLVAEFGLPSWEGQWSPLSWVHDELQIAVRPEIAERVREILLETIPEVGIEFNLRCPLTGEGKIGRSWSDCH